MNTKADPASTASNHEAEEDEEALTAPEAVSAICAILDGRDRPEQRRILRAACVLAEIEADFDEPIPDDETGDRG